MKRKALITGAKPQPFEGPWVSLEIEKKWEFEGLRNGVRLERLKDMARVLIGVPDGDERISVIAVEIS